MPDPSRVRIYRGAPFFATRKAAHPIAAEIASAAATGGAVIADWSGIEAVTGAFMDEYVILTKDRDVTNEHMNDDVLETYALILGRQEGRTTFHHRGECPSYTAAATRSPGGRQ
jgi:hypothetical protein